MHEERRLRIRRQLLGLATPEVRVEAEALLVGVLEEHHSHRRPPVECRGRERHRFGGNDSSGGGIREPGLELEQRIRPERH